MKKNEDREKINSIWREVWKRDAHSSAAVILGNRLSVESYKIIKKYIP